MEKLKPVFNRRIFWDIDFDKLDYELKYKFVIERVFERGDVEDIRQCRRYYGDEKVKAALTQAKWLAETTLNFVSVLFDIPLEQFRCYTLRQLTPGLYPY
jgi:hypothetical protein